MKKALRKLIPTLIMVLVAASMVGTSTYAWFSMNKKVEITGMTVTAEIGSNLFIAADDNGVAGTTKITADASFANAAITQSVTGILEPVSTVNGTSFFYTVNAAVSGDANADDYVAYNESAFRTAYGVGTAVGYVDYVFQLRAVNTTASARDIDITQLNLIYAGATADERTAEMLNKSFRVAFFVEDITSANPAGTVGALRVIYTASGAANFSDSAGDNYAVSAAATAPTAMSLNYNTLSAAAGTGLVQVAANSTAQYKVVVRMWIEGEDTTCNNATFADLSHGWSLGIKMELDDGSTVTNATSLSKYVSATVSTTTYYYNGTKVWDDIAKIGIDAQGTAIASADAAVQTAFGYVAP